MRKDRWGLILVLPSILVLIAILIIPLIYNIYLSFFEIKYLQVGKFIGFGNYIRALNSQDFLFSLKITFIVAIAGLLIALSLGTLLALWINSKQGIKTYFVQIVALVPWVISMVVGTLLWKWIFDSIGLLNFILVTVLGLESTSFLSHTTSAQIALIFVISWRTIGLSMVFMLAGLKGIPKDLDEAGQIDGANKWNIFWSIKVPLLKTSILITSIILTLGNFNNVEVPLVLTGGGPAGATNMLIMNVYEQAFVYNNFGISSALTIIAMLVNVILITFYVKAVRYNV
jgi:ABC-type sugar transport system permease subunit